MARTASRRRKADLSDADRRTLGGGASAGSTGKTAPAERRTAILQAATRRFAQFGFEATTVRQIADDVNILSGSLYHYFETKEEMLHEIVRDAALQIQNNTLRIAQAPVDAERRLIALI